MPLNNRESDCLLSGALFSAEAYKYTSVRAHANGDNAADQAFPLRYEHLNNTKLQLLSRLFFGEARKWLERD